jgi:uncharacterized membrane protein HdeD (DUF308 family)
MSAPFSVSPAGLQADEIATLRGARWAFFALGLVSVIAGFIAIGSTFIATLLSVKVFGVLLLVAGIAEVVHAVMVRNLKGFALHLLSAVLYLIAGLFMLEDPVRAAAVITLLLSAAFLVGGVLRIVFSLVVRFPAWGWVLLNGVVDLILGILIWREWPESSLWVIGLFVGIELLFHGWAWIILALTVPRISSAQPA